MTAVVDTIASPFRSILFRYRKEAIAFENLLFSKLTWVLILFAPVLIVGSEVLTVPLLGETTVAEYQSSNPVFQFGSILWVRVFYMVIISIIFSMRFKQIQEDGRLGYWLTLGIERREFLWYSVVYTSFVLSFSIIQLYVLLSVFTAFIISTLSLVVIFVSSFLLNLVLIGFSLFLTELLENSEISVFLINLVYIVVTYFSGDTGIIKQIVLPEYAAIGANLAIIYVIYIAGIAVLFLLSLRAFNLKNIELGG